MAQGTPCLSGRGPGPLTSQWLAFPASGNLAETNGFIVQQPCHRCQETQALLFSSPESTSHAAGIDSVAGLDIGDMKSHPRRNSLRDSYGGAATPVMESTARLA